MPPGLYGDRKVVFRPAPARRNRASIRPAKPGLHDMPYPDARTTPDDFSRCSCSKRARAAPDRAALVSASWLGTLESDISYLKAELRAETRRRELAETGAAEQARQSAAELAAVRQECRVAIWTQRCTEIEASSMEVLRALTADLAASRQRCAESEAEREETVRALSADLLAWQQRWSGRRPARPRLRERSTRM